MEVYVKDYSTWRTIKKATALSSELFLDSLDKENSTMSVAGTGINRNDAGNWLIAEGNVYWISQVKPKNENTVLTLLSPLDAFSRKIPFVEQPADQTIGGFIAAMLQQNWCECEDPVYALPYLTVSESDTAPFVLPEVDNAGLVDLPAYCRLVRRTYRIAVRFKVAGAKLQCLIAAEKAANRQVSFEDGRSQLKGIDYGTSGTAKITALQDGVASVWYLSESGEISQDVPDRRAVGSWETISISSGSDVVARVAETFAKGRSGHKVEFMSELDLAVLDDCKLFIHGEMLHSYISSKKKSSLDHRYQYKAGELATKATEKIRGVIK